MYRSAPTASTFQRPRSAPSSGAMAAVEGRRWVGCRSRCRRGRWRRRSRQRGDDDSTDRQTGQRGSPDSAQLHESPAIRRCSGSMPDALGFVRPDVPWAPTLLRGPAESRGLTPRFGVGEADSVGRIGVVEGREASPPVADREVGQAAPAWRQPRRPRARRRGREARRLGSAARGCGVRPRCRCRWR